MFCSAINYMNGFVFSLLPLLFMIMYRFHSFQNFHLNEVCDECLEGCPSTWLETWNLIWKLIVFMAMLSIDRLNACNWVIKRQKVVIGTKRKSQMFLFFESNDWNFRVFVNIFKVVLCLMVCVLRNQNLEMNYWIKKKIFSREKNIETSYFA
jgi:hypothetical protein